MPNLRVVLDTNVLMSGLAYPASIPGQIVVAWRQGALDVVMSRSILDEVARVLPRLHHRLHWKDADFADLLDILAIQADLVEPRSVPAGNARDTADLPVLGTLLAAQADYLITGAQHLLVLANKHPVLTPAEFWQKHGG